jgi:ribosomal silencing factor RsfS
MAKYTVVAKSTSYYYLTVDADTKDEALRIGEEADGADFLEIEGEGDWVIIDAHEENYI